MKVVYILGKITGMKIEYAKQNFYFACKEVKKYDGADFVVNPFDIKPFLGIKVWFCYMINDIRKLRKCSHIAMQKNWTESRGACIEHIIARHYFKIPVIYL